jgi:hypothetical protein
MNNETGLPKNFSWPGWDSRYIVVANYDSDDEYPVANTNPSISVTDSTFVVSPVEPVDTRRQYAFLYYISTLLTGCIECAVE